MMIDSRTPPHDLDAERSLLGAVLLSPECFDEVCRIVREADFYHGGNRAVWIACCKMRADGIPIDPITLARELSTAGKLESAGGLSGLQELLASPWNVAHAAHYAGIVTEQADRRRLVDALTSAYGAALKDQSPTGDIVGDLQRATDAIQQRTAGDSLCSIGDVVNGLLESATDPQPATPTGLLDLDQTLDGGFRPGQLVILAARPGCGKTALALQVADTVAKHGPTLFVSLEMSRHELGLRAVAQNSSVPVKRLTNGEEWPHAAEVAAFEMQSRQLTIDDAPRRTVSQVAAAARLMKRKHGLGLIVVDYLQLLTPDDSRQPREQQVANMTRSLKGLAKELGVPVLCLAQLNRAVEQRETKRPRLSDLRESGAIEQDADIVVFLDRPALNDPKAPQDAAQAIVAKHRNGRTGTVDLRWDGNTMRFSNAVNFNDPF